MKGSRLHHRFTINKTVVAPIGVTAMVLSTVAFGLSSAQAEDNAAAPTFGDWAWSSYTDWQEGPATPTDPDSQDGDSNPLNLFQIGEGGPGQSPGVYEREVAGAPTTESSGWVNTKPAGDGWVQVDEKKVVDIAGVAGHWVNYNWNGGPVDGAPTFPGDGWHSNNGNHTGHPEPVDGLTYQQGRPGNADWFHWELEGQVDEVSHTVYRYERTVPGQTVVEYRWSVYARSYTPGVEPGDVDTEDPTDEPIVQPGDTSTDQPADESPVTGTEAAPKSSTHAKPTAEQTAVPTSIEAGL